MHFIVVVIVSLQDIIIMKGLSRIHLYLNPALTSVCYTVLYGNRPILEIPFVTASVQASNYTVLSCLIFPSRVNHLSIIKVKL